MGRADEEPGQAPLDAPLRDLIADDLDVLFCGINPGMVSAATGRHFANPGTRFWPALHRSGSTPRRLRPDEEGELLGMGLGVTTLIARATAGTDELGGEEYVEGGRTLRRKVLRHRPGWLAVLGIVAYREAFAERGATVGPRSLEIGGTRMWLLPNPSGRNAHWQPGPSPRSSPGCGWPRDCRTAPWTGDPVAPGRHGGIRHRARGPRRGPRP